MVKTELSHGAIVFAAQSLAPDMTHRKTFQTATRERERDRQTDRQRDRQTDRQRGEGR